MVSLALRDHHRYTDYGATTELSGGKGLNEMPEHRSFESGMRCPEELFYFIVSTLLCNQVPTTLFFEMNTSVLYVEFKIFINALRPAAAHLRWWSELGSHRSSGGASSIRACRTIDP